MRTATLERADPPAPTGDALPTPFDRRLTPLDATETEASPTVETRWVPLVPETSDVEWTSRSGAFLMLATRADEPTAEAPIGPPALPPGPPPGMDVRTALVSCLEAILPELEPGWSHCGEHPRCRAVQQASEVLWGSVGTAPTATAPGADVPGIGERLPVGPSGPAATLSPEGNLELMSRAAPSRAGP